MTLTPFIAKFWWIALCSGAILLSGTMLIQNKRDQKGLYLQKIAHLEAEIERSSKEREDLLSLIKYHDDPEALELALKRVFGLVPQGSFKLYFEKE